MHFWFPFTLCMCASARVLNSDGCLPLITKIQFFYLSISLSNHKFFFFLVGRILSAIHIFSVSFFCVCVSVHLLNLRRFVYYIFPFHCLLYGRILYRLCIPCASVWAKPNLRKQQFFCVRSSTKFSLLFWQRTVIIKIIAINIFPFLVNVIVHIFSSSPSHPQHVVCRGRVCELRTQPSIIVCTTSFQFSFSSVVRFFCCCCCSFGWLRNFQKRYMFSNKKVFTGCFFGLRIFWNVNACGCGAFVPFFLCTAIASSKL